MIKCLDCGAEFEEEEVGHEEEFTSEFWGAPASVDVCVCPFCRSDDIEEFDPDDLEGEE